jgi:diguanylate cyclase
MSIQNTSELIPKVLLVDDNPQNLVAMEMVLEDMNLDIVKTTSGKDALTALMIDEYALVLLDVQMPEMDGFEVAELMQNNSHLKNIPIVFVTAINKEDRYVKKSMEVGAVDYLFKPIDSTILISKVKIFVDYYLQNKKMVRLVDELNKTQASLMITNKELEMLARFDPVTGLANRLDFTNFLDVEIDNAKRHNRLIALLLIDLDNFKNVNDTHGHQVGDELLREVSKRLKESVRKRDAINRPSAEHLVSRLGGDEFAIVLTELDSPENAAVVARRMIQSVNKPVVISGSGEAQVGVSIGIACYPDSGANAEELCRSADLAMYDAKNKGKNTYRFFSKKLNAAHEYHTMIETGIKNALKTEKFYMVYQPIVDLATQKTVAFEALCRCDLKAIQKIPTQDFILVAEESGLMMELGVKILNMVLQDAKETLLPCCPDLEIHVNVSTRQLQDDAFLKLVKRSYKAFGVNPKNITFELTETAVMEDVQVLTDHLDGISETGSKVSIDDFGTGYSSLVWLRHLPISSLKIDKEFIENVCVNQNDAVITKSIVNLSKNLELRSIAEGIESKEQLDFLVKHHCPLGQGHYFSKPMKLNDAVAYLQKNH